MGCEDVLDSSLPCFEKSSLDLCAKVGVTVGFDAVAGEFSGKMLKGLSSGVCCMSTPKWLLINFKTCPYTTSYLQEDWKCFCLLG